MKALGKFRTEIALITFWLLNAANTVSASRKVGYYPPSVREQAQTLASSMPYPWFSILITWLVLAITTVGIYLIIRKTTRKIQWVLIYSFALSILDAMFTPTDVGGVYYAITQYYVCTFVIALSWGICSLIKKRVGNVSAL